MPELPEIYVLSKQLNNVLPNRVIEQIVVHQSKSINLELDDFIIQVSNQTCQSVTSKGKWLFIHFVSGDQLQINLGMGGDLLYRDAPPEGKYQCHILFDNHKYLTFRFWWFGSIHFVRKHCDNKSTATLGIDLLRDNISEAKFVEIIRSKKGSLKTVLLNQKVIAGIGNYYIHDILFQAKIHPLKKCPDVKDKELKILYKVIKDEFQQAIQQGGSYYEVGIDGFKGTFKADLVAYKTDQPCPICQTTIEKIKTGSTSSYFCPKCQKYCI